MRSGAWLVLALAAVLAAPRGDAAPIVAGYERFGRHAPDEAGHVEAGLLLLGELGCANCHAPAGPALAQVSTKPAPLLDGVGRRVEPGWLADFLADPRGMHPGTTMPDLLAGLPKERRDRAATALAHFLASTGPFATTRYAWSVTGKATNELVYEQCGCATCHGSRREGVEPLPDHRPLGDLGRKWHPAELDAFLKDPAKIRPGGRMPAIPLSDKERRGLVTSLVGGVDLADAPAAADFTVDPALAAEGRATFTTAGCAACHRLEGVGIQAREIPERVSRPLAELAVGEAGCLAERPPAAAADYGLDAGQRASLAAALAWLRSPAAAMPPERAGAIDRALTMLNCYACHDRDGKGGTLPAVATLDDDGEPVLVEAARDGLFAAAQAELGDEGRRPPTLTAVGSKLRPEFLEAVLREGGRDRAAIMPTRMPKWTAAIGAPLAAALAADPPVACAIPPLAGHDDDEVVAQGRHLVGAKALGCIKCHAFGGDKGQSLGLVDMTRMPVRLRHEWFLAYVADPQAYRRGTRMPASWPEGRTFHPDVLDGTASGQIEAVWRYLASVKPRPPIGAGRRVIELAPTDRPILYRNFIENAGPRGIGVGFPEGVHIAWDAEALRLALVWRGEFIDAGRHWSGRGEGWQPPLGDGVFTPDAGAAVETLPDAGASWPAETPRSRGARFLGYALDAAGRPTFRWRHGGMTVEEHVEPVQRDSDRVLRRTLRLVGRPAGGTTMIRAATGRVENGGDGWWRVDGRWKVRVSGDRGEPVLCDESGRSDLRAPVAWTADATAEIVEELAW